MLAKSKSNNVPRLEVYMRRLHERKAIKLTLRGLCNNCQRYERIPKKKTESYNVKAIGITQKSAEVIVGMKRAPTGKGNRGGLTEDPKD